MNLPIDVVPDTRPPRFRWRQTVGTPVGPHVADCEGSLPPSVEGAVADLITLAKQQAQEIMGLRRTSEESALARDKLQAFKDWVHAYLDRHDVPQHPPGEQGVAGCRIGDRLNWLVARERAEGANTNTESGPPEHLLPPAPQSITSRRGRGAK